MKCDINVVNYRYTVIYTKLFLYLLPPLLRRLYPLFEFLVRMRNLHTAGQWPRQ